MAYTSPATKSQVTKIMFLIQSVKPFIGGLWDKIDEEYKEHSIEQAVKKCTVWQASELIKLLMHIDNDKIEDGEFQLGLTLRELNIKMK